MKVIGIDFGLKRIGIALANTELGTAVPLKFIKHKNMKVDAGFIQEITNEFEADKIVLGYPLNMDGTESDMSRIVKNFKKKLEIVTNLPVILIDERLSSFAAEEELKQIMPDFKKRKKYLDSLSAVIILRDYMEVHQ
jgi:putative Holliday junction resolvase